MNTELLHSLEQRISQAVEEITFLRQNISQLEAQKNQLIEDSKELQQVINTNKEQQQNWELSMSNMLTNLNKLDDSQ